MKLRSFRYLLGEGFKNTWANRLMTLASIGVLVACMVIIGLALLISENVNKAMGELEKQNVIMAFMEDESWAIYGTDSFGNTNENVYAEDGSLITDSSVIDPDSYVIHNDEEALELCKKIEKIDNVKKVEFVSNEEALEIATADMDESQKEYFSFLKEESGNPISCAARVTMEDMSKFSETKREILKLEGIDSIRSQDDLADKISALEKGLGIAGVWIVAILIIISLIIVSNTIRVTMYTRKLEISIMKAVGATDAFVRIPFVVEGMLIGFISALLSEVLVYFCYRIATETIMSNLSTSGVVAFSEMAIPLLIVFIAIGVIAGAIGSFIMISKYLRREGSEFAAI